MDQEAAALLRTKGLRSTVQRRAVLTALRGHPHSTAADLESRIGVATGGKSASKGPGGLSRQGLYNVLDDLTQVGLIRCIEPAGSPTRYELRVGDNHHHVVCRSCGRIEDVDCTVGRAPCLEPEDDRGFSIDEAEIIWWGLCGSCRTAGG
ncbi:Fur family transcriptional regulator [Streptomyces sp. NPDC059063]|uniref:Fur family transcriptional regulator n=1 Tax=unclassified Streptomyces TaxID=2593676 RepID=UPI003684CF61